MLLAVLAIALGVALGLAVQLINRSAVDELTQGVRTIAGDADLTVRGARSGFSEQVFAQFARDPDVAVASPIVEVDVRVAGAPEPLRVLGLDLFRAAAIQPALFREGGERYDALRSDTIFLSNAAQAWLGLERGATLVLQSGLADVPLRDKVYCPPSGACPRCGVATSDWVDVADRGTITTFCIVRVPSENIELKLPYCAADILLDGSDMPFIALLQECDPAAVRVGMRVEAVWRPREEWTSSFENIRHFRPSGEPDVPIETLGAWV